MKKVSKKAIGPHKTTLESKKTVNNEKPKRGNKAVKTPSKSSHESQLSKKSKSNSEANPESKGSKSVSIKDKKKIRDIQRIPGRWILNPYVQRSIIGAERTIVMPNQRFAQKVVQIWI